jgi:hypothetical protein
LPNFRNLMSGDSGGAGLVEVENSALFVPESQSLSRTQTAGSNTVWTFSSWIYKCETKNQVFLNFGTGGANGQLGWGTADTLYIYNGASVVGITTQVFRDIGWYHIHLAYNTGESGTDKVKLSVNGSLVTAWGTDNRASAGAFEDANQNTQVAYLGNNSDTSNTSFSGYMAETVMLDGTASAVTNFGEYDETGLYWTPKSSDDIKALTFGTNGFYQNYSDSSDVGADQNAYITPTEGTAEFDGTNDYTKLSSQLTGSADGVSGFVSLWVNMAADGVNTHIMAGTKSGGDFYVNKNTSDYIQVYLHNVPVNAVALKLVCSTTQIKAASGWQHVLISWTSGGVHYIYVNDVAQSFSTATHTSADMLGAFTSFTVGSFYTGGNKVNGSLADVIYSQNYIDISNETNRRKFITADLYPATWATAIDTVTDPLVGMHLDVGEAVANFANNADGTGQAFTINGTLTSGPDINYQGGNNFTNNNTVTTTDLMSPTKLPRLLWNPLSPAFAANLSEGNTVLKSPTVHKGCWANTNFPKTGKWQTEVLVDINRSGDQVFSFGVMKNLSAESLNQSVVTNSQAYGWYHSTNIHFYSATSQLFQLGSGRLPIATHKFQICWDASAEDGTADLFFGVDNVWYAADGGTDGNPVTGANPTIVNLDISDSEWSVLGIPYTTTLSLATADEAAWEYTIQTGYTALTLTNIAASVTRTQSDPYEHWNNILYTGNGTAIGSGGNAITGAGFQPDFGWIKGRSGATENALTDIVRGVTKELSSNDTGAEETVAEGLTAFGSDGFTVGSNGSYNTSSATYVAWCAKLGGAASTNEDGSIDSSVSVNQTLGMSVGTYSGNSTAGATIGHGLGVTPHMVMVKRTNTTGNWFTYHINLDPTAPEDKYVLLNTTGTIQDDITQWNDTAPTSSVISLGNSVQMNASGNTYMFMAFAPSEYISIGSYEGNANTNGTFVPTLNSLGVPLQPIWTMIKQISIAGNSWNIKDTARDDINPMTKDIKADTTAAESGDSSDKRDNVSGGIKLRANYTGANSATTYIHLTIGIPTIDVDGRILAGR